MPADRTPAAVKARRFACAALCLAGLLATAQTLVMRAPSARRGARVVIAVSTVLDGKGHVLRDTRLVIEGARIVALDRDAGPVDHDLRGLTVLPGWIDSHVHITRSFGADGRAEPDDLMTPEAARAAASNARATLMAGFTTVQSLGSRGDIPLRDAIAAGRIPGPRILTAATPLLGQRGVRHSPDELRAFVRAQKAAGADVIKIFAVGSVFRTELLLSPAELAVACGEARRLGLRSLVHAYGPSVREVVLAGCSQIEHGALATDADLALMAARGTYLDPQAGLVMENYLANKPRFLGALGFSEGSFARIEQTIPVFHESLRRAAKIPGLAIVFGSDAVAGMHGRNAEEMVERVRDLGLDPMRVLVSAGATAAEALGMARELGSIAPGLQADVIALDGDPLEDITAVRRVVFVMKGGVVYKNERRAQR